MSKANVIAILVADIHLSHKPPLARSEEPDWYEAMARPLRQLRDLAHEHEVPIVCAGDVFDHWNSPPELINFALQKLPKMYAISGQHDQPNHSYDEIHRSAYWTMVEAGIIDDLELSDPERIPFKRTSSKADTIMGTLWLWGFPWGSDVFPWGSSVSNEKVRTRTSTEGDIHLAVIHAYCWTGSHSYPNAKDESSRNVWVNKLFGFEAAAFGDNHKGFIQRRCHGGECNIINCGTFMRRTSDEVDYQPSVGFLYSDGTISRYFLDCSEDVFTVTEKREDQPELDVSKLVEELSTLAEGAVDFTEAVKRYCEENGVEKDVRSIIKEAMDK